MLKTTTMGVHWTWSGYLDFAGALRCSKARASRIKFRLFLFAGAFCSRVLSVMGVKSAGAGTVLVDVSVEMIDVVVDTTFNCVDVVTTESVSVLLAVTTLVEAEAVMRSVDVEVVVEVMVVVLPGAVV